MAELRVEKYSHHFRVLRITPRARPAVIGFVRRFIHYQLRKKRGHFENTADKTYAFRTEDKTEFSFHINTFDDFIEHLTQFHLKGDLVEVITMKEAHAEPAEFEFQPGWEPYDYQIPFIEYLSTTYPNGPRAKLGAIQTGKGKTFSSLWSVAKRGVRAAIIVKARFFDQWIEAVHDHLVLDPKKDVMIIRKGEHLKGLIDLAMRGEYCSKIVMIASDIIHNYVKAYKHYGEGIEHLGFGCPPRLLFHYLGVGERVIDELHEDFHRWFLFDLQTHVQNSTSLTASLVADDHHIQRMMDTMHPPETRYQGQEYHKYVAATAVFYRFAKPTEIKSTNKQGYYSQHELESWILEDDQRTANYMEFIHQLVLGDYFQGRREGDKCLVYASSIDMCTMLADYFSQTYPMLDCRRYTELDPRENVIEPHIRFTTLGKAGAAVDIPGLTSVILSNARKATSSNIQGFGRLRELKDGRTPRFTYAVCEDISKQLEYHEAKQLLLRDMALTRSSFTYGTPI